MNKYIFVCLSLLLVSCSSDNGDPLENLVNSKNSNEIFALSGKVMVLDFCKPDTKPDAKCTAHINTIVTNLNKNGFDKITLSHFQGASLNQYLIKLSLSEDLLFKLNTRPPKY